MFENHFTNQAQFFNLFGFFVTICSLNGLQAIATVETMNFRIPYFVKILQFYRIKNEDGVLQYTFDRMDEILKFFMNSAPAQSWSRNHNIFQFISSSRSYWCWGGGVGLGGGHSTSAFYSVKVYVRINPIGWGAFWPGP